MEDEINKFYCKWFASAEKYRMVAWCPDCLTYGTPFMSRNDRQCGNCNGRSLKYLIDENAIKDLETELEQAERKAFGAARETIGERDEVVYNSFEDYKEQEK